MKTSKLILAAILVFTLAFALCGCGEKAAPAEEQTEAPAATQAATAEAPATEAPEYTGAYTSFAYTAEELGLGDVLISSESMGTMSFILNEDGTGTATLNDEDSGITWKVDGEKLTLTSDDGNEVTGTIKDGVMDVVMETDGVTGHVYLAKPDADTSAYTVLSVEEAMSKMLSETTAE